MYRCLLLLLPLTLGACTGAITATQEEPETPVSSSEIQYPEARRESVLDTYHGVEVADPYRWLEDPDAADTKAWVDANNVLTQGWLDGTPRQAINTRLTELWNYAKTGVPRKTAGRYLFMHNDGLLPQPQLKIAESLGGEARVLLDPTTLSEDGTTSLSDYALSPDGKVLAYAISQGGSDWNIVRFRDVESGEDREDELRWMKFSELHWRNDSSGLWYSRYPEPEPGNSDAALYHQKVYFHRLGTPQSADTLVFEDPEHPQRGFSIRQSDDDTYGILSVWEGTEEKSRVYLLDLSDPEKPVNRLLDDWDANWRYMGNVGHDFYFLTTKDAPKERILKIDVRKGGPEAWTEVVPESEHVIRGARLVGGKLFVRRLVDASSEVSVYSLAGELESKVELPGLGTVEGFEGEPGDTETFYSFSSFTTPTRIYRYDIAAGESTLWAEPKVSFDPEAYTTEQVFVTSKDGTKVPMFLSYKKGLERTGDTPTLLYGYGGFNIPITPGFSVGRLVWMEMGGVYASANLRGGGEYGEAWHAQGTKTQKQNVFDDFIACGEWLTTNGWTKPERLAIQGRSNGGLLVGATLLQRPDLFGAALPGVGVLDMLRYHKFTIGWAWASDYGTVEDKAEFEALYAYSPVHNAQPDRYPPTMIITADHDDRVVPAHSFKFGAALQHAQQGDAPILMRIDTMAGHGAGKSTAQAIAETADQWGFLARALDFEPTLPSLDAP